MTPAHWYDTFGKGYNHKRNPDARVQQQISAALGDARSVANVGAGTGAYEPLLDVLIALEPSSLMVSEYRGQGQLVRAAAEQLPLADQCVDVTLASLTMHHWLDWRVGLREMTRVARKSVVIFTHDPMMNDFWLFDYFPEIHAMDLEIFTTLPVISDYAAQLGFTATHHPVAVPADCTDGFLGAYWRRPHAYLDEDVRAAISSFNKLNPEVLQRGILALRQDLDNGVWEQRHGSLLARDELDIGYRLVVLTRR